VVVDSQLSWQEHGHEAVAGVERREPDEEQQQELVDEEVVQVLGLFLSRQQCVLSTPEPICEASLLPASFPASLDGFSCTV
jgi:hypothetical protein